MNKIQNVTIGTDPELFLYDSEKKEVISAVGIIPGSKHEPYKIKELGRGFALQTDNVLIEFNVPAVKLEDKNGFINNIQKMKDYITKYVKNVNPNFTLLHKASAKLKENQLNSAQAWEFACDPDFNCYTNLENQKPVLEDLCLRSAGFHIHIGYSNPDLKTSLTILKYMDAYLGIPSVLLDTDTKRRDLYGKAGCFRLQKYGLEYRVLSGYFLNSINTIGFVYDQVIKALDAFDSDKKLPKFNDVIKTINDSDIELAKTLIVNYNLI